MKNTRHTVRSMQGKEVDFEKLRLANALEPAVGNVRVNTRGDEIGPNGEIIRKREEIVNYYYKTNPKAVKDEVKLPPVTKTKEVDGVNYELRGGKWYVA